MFGSLANSVAAKANALETKLMLYIVAGIVVLVIVNILLEGIRLGGVEEGVYFLNAAPINLGGSDGAPCRAVLIRF